MEFLLVINCLVAVFNTLLLVAIAGTTAKMLRYMGNESEEVLGPSADRHLMDLPKQPSYADMMSAPNYDGFQPRPPNSDGIGGLIDKP